MRIDIDNNKQYSHLERSLPEENIVRFWFTVENVRYEMNRAEE